MILRVLECAWILPGLLCPGFLAHPTLHSHTGARNTCDNSCPSTTSSFPICLVHSPSALPTMPQMLSSVPKSFTKAIPRDIKTHPHLDKLFTISLLCLFFFFFFFFFFFLSWRSLLHGSIPNLSIFRTAADPVANSTLGVRFLPRSTSLYHSLRTLVPSNLHPRPSGKRR